MTPHDKRIGEIEARAAKFKKYRGVPRPHTDMVYDTDVHYLLADREKLEAYVASLEAECMAVTECAYALSSAVNLAGNYDRNARILLHQQAKAERLFYALFAARNDKETVGVRLLREKNEAAALAPTGGQ